MMYLICPLVTLLICQLFKNMYNLIRNNDKHVVSTGGMPSTHTAFVSSLTFLIGYKLGFDSPIFAISFIFSSIVCYDAITVRYESGMHAKILNEKYKTNLKEKIGHNILEVIVGIIIGFISATIFNLGGI